MSARLAALLALLVACDGGTAPADDSPPAGTGDTEDPIDDSDPEPVPVSADFQADVVPMFYRSCGAGENACHSAVAYHPQPPDCLGWLSLEDAALGSLNPTNGQPTGCPDLELYDRLLELPAWSCFVEGTEMPYVVPGDLDGSYLWQKVLRNGVHCYGSDQMPLASDLDDADKAILEAWIAAGASP